MFVKLTSLEDRETYINLRNVCSMNSFNATSGRKITTITFIDGSFKNVLEDPEDILKFPIPWIEKNPSNVQRI